MSPRIPTVRIRPQTVDHYNAINKRGPEFWERETNNGLVRLICVDKDGIPWVAEFIFIESKYIVRPGDDKEVGYGRNDTLKAAE